MVTINKPVDYMRVYVTPAQFSELYELKQRAALDGHDAEIVTRLSRLLSRCAHENGGTYDAERHRKGAMVELSVLV